MLLRCLFTDFSLLRDSVPVLLPMLKNLGETTIDHKERAKPLLLSLAMSLTGLASVDENE